MLISRYQLNDAELGELDQLLETVQKHDGGLPSIYKYLLILRRDSPCNLLYYVEADNHKPQLVGFLSLYFFYHDSCEVSLVVHPEHRHMGIAKHLIKTAYETHLNKQIKQLYFSSAVLRDRDWQKLHDTYLHHTEYHLERRLTTQEKIPNKRLSIREATLDDIKVLGLLDEECFLEKDADMAYRFRTLIEDDNYIILVASLDKNIIGKTHLKFDTENTILSDLAIFPHYQHKGYGSELLAYAINYTIKNGLPTLRLDVETAEKPILDLYLKHGFGIDNQTYFYVKKL